MKHALIFAGLLAAFAGYKAFAQTTIVPKTVMPIPINPNATVPNPGTNIFPPPEYDHEYEGDLTIKIVSTVEQLKILCRVDNPKLLACSFHNNKSCLVIMVDDSVMRHRGWSTGMLLRHERGHCNGWPGDHPGIVPVPKGTPLWVNAVGRVKIPEERWQEAERIRP